MVEGSKIRTRQEWHIRWEHENLGHLDIRISSERQAIREMQQTVELVEGRRVEGGTRAYHSSDSGCFEGFGAEDRGRA